jgi:hypothetical protein
MNVFKPMNIRGQGTCGMTPLCSLMTWPLTNIRRFKKLPRPFLFPPSPISSPRLSHRPPPLPPPASLADTDATNHHITIGPVPPGTLVAWRRCLPALSSPDPQFHPATTSWTLPAASWPATPPRHHLLNAATTSWMPGHCSRTPPGVIPNLQSSRTLPPPAPHCPTPTERRRCWTPPSASGEGDPPPLPYYFHVNLHECGEIWVNVNEIWLKFRYV